MALTDDQASLLTAFHPLVKLGCIRFDTSRAVVLQILQQQDMSQQSISSAV